jgi:hypothetical protein
VGTELGARCPPPPPAGTKLPGHPATDASRATSEPHRGLPALSVPSPRRPDEPVHTMIGDDSRPDLDRVVLGDVVLGRFHSTAARHRTPFGKERRDRLRAQAKPSARRCRRLSRPVKSGPPAPAEKWTTPSLPGRCHGSAENWRQSYDPPIARPCIVRVETLACERVRWYCHPLFRSQRLRHE